jgi:anti-sigma factor RsiW
MGKTEDERLQRYFDGELTPDERAQVEAALSDDDRLKLAALGEVRGLVANALSAEAAGIDLWPSLEKELRPRGAAAAKAQRRWGLRAHPASWSAGFMAAAAAALLFLFQPWHSPTSGNDCDVVSLETSGAVATVFHMSDTPGRGDGPTTVIWTEEQD